jgi:hypothetical protein
MPSIVRPRRRAADEVALAVIRRLEPHKPTIAVMATGRGPTASVIRPVSGAGANMPATWRLTTAPMKVRS